MSKNKNIIGTIEPYWEKIHGRTKDSSKDIDNHYMVDIEITAEEYYNTDLDKVRSKHITDKFLKVYRRYVSEYITNRQKLDILSPKNNTSHLNINNLIEYMRDMSKLYKYHAKYYNNNLHIIEIIKLEGEEEVAIIKTFWLKILQRKYKKYYRLYLSNIAKRGK